MRLGSQILMVFFILFSVASIGQGEKEGVLSRLLAPGPLIGGHKDLEGSDCLKCHDAGKGIPDSKCLDCHKEIRPSVEKKTGFHGLVTEACIKCHSDHKGRDYDSVKIDEKKFDHGKQTGYILEGKHSEIKCQDCHKEKRTKKYLRPNDTHYTGKTKTCVSCHKKDDVHFYKGEFAAKDCNACHGLKSWKEGIKFNHDRDTKYKLEGKHAKLKCNDCHQPNKKIKNVMLYKWPKLPTQQCLTCHQDQHKNNFSPQFRGGGKCLECHTQNEWKIPSFDHKKTGYKLLFKHADAKCIECHKQPNKKGKAPEIKDFKFTGLKQACLTCHKDQHLFDPQKKSHKLGDLNSCAKCHDESGWKKIHDFTHNQTTRYSIDGKHENLKCGECHLPNTAKFALEKDPGKKLNIRRPGKYGVYRWDALEAKTCENCHVNPHIGQFKKEFLEKKCSMCHTTEGWQLMRSGQGFDHSKTRFALTGAHTTTRCAECHQINGKQVFKYKSYEQGFCIDCHKNVHDKQFSNKFLAQSCKECHNTKKFTERLDFDHSKTRYPLEGGHIKVKCLECHKPTQEKFLLVKPNINARDLGAKRFSFKSNYLFPKLAETKCLTCHKDYHRGQLGNDCQKCHTVNEWKKTTFNHNTMSRFPLVDKHKNVQCSKCHVGAKENTKYKPLGQMCIDCHKDVHKGSFGKQCQECHTVRGWNLTKDFHKNFTLTGVHYSLECAECHKDGRKLAGLSQQCISCHTKDDAHTGTLPNCKECHRQHFWEVSGFKHSLTRFPLRGAHRTAECLDCHYQGGSQTIYQGLNTACSSCHASDFNGASPGHTTQTSSSDCSSCHKNFFAF